MDDYVEKLNNHPNVDDNVLTIFIHFWNVTIPDTGGNYTVGLYSQRSPYTEATKREVDPNLGRHDDFLLLGPYIFAQRNDSGRIHLYISYLRQPFNLTMIPTTDPHDVRESASSYISVLHEKQESLIELLVRRHLHITVLAKIKA